MRQVGPFNWDNYWRLRRWWYRHFEERCYWCGHMVWEPGRYVAGPTKRTLTIEAPYGTMWAGYTPTYRLHERCVMEGFAKLEAEPQSIWKVESYGGGE